ncbi:hypothetical protein HH214_18835 [Mucilaginibacter robiniae]|uniref:Alpha-2-macroglobulin n=1 Tax=Mucilaginibacter robiniae TaxID=2728022 RepID=A0A7L5EA51_9SPHI|nr:MG2 domain-containing protein [Mucilaginibacter robiniae]QJD97783.1 hypothetical protein HH214_18835 [Mucilaginibacter robiniae]
MSRISANFSRSKIIIILATVSALFLIVFLVFKHKKKESQYEFNKYIQSYTAGVISRTSTIRIKLSDEVQITHGQNEELKNDVFDFSPSVKGKAYWVDAQTVEFRPEKELEPNKKYDVDFDLGSVVKVNDELNHFTFDFQTIKPDFTIDYNGLQTATSTSLDKMKFSGVIQTADVEDEAKVEKMITTSYPSAVNVTWHHDRLSKTHQFVINNLLRSTGKASELIVKYEGSSANMDENGTETVNVPAIGDFKLLNVRAVQDQDQYVLYQFSNPIKVGQELRGLIGVNGISDLAYTIEGSMVKVYGPERLQGNYTAFTDEGIEDIVNKKISRTYSSNVFFENRLPSVTIPGKGVILPDSGRLMMPFEAVNLNAVDVTIIKIYENNVPQYFQNNDFNGQEQLRQVAKPVVKTTIRLDRDKGLNLNKKNRFMLDIDHLMRTEPGAIYRVVIGFRRSYSLYNCSTKATAENSNKDTEASDYDDEGYRNSSNTIDEDDEFWQRYDSYYPEGYNWDEKDDVCSDSYYTKDRWATRNIIASNIGLITKRGNDNSMMIAVTNIIDAQPMSGVDLQLLDYQKQVLWKGTSDGDGFAKLTLKRKPYLLIASKGDERGYLKLDDGSALPLSRFDVGGEQVQNGLKGFIYGERGVWRPGDSIFVSFILEDKLKTLPPDHPVEFEFYNPQGQLYKKMIRTSSVDGFYSFHTSTTTSSPTGTWNAKIKVGGAVFEKSIKVETIMPNRLKLSLSFNNQTELTKGSTNGTLSAKWLFGGIAQNLKAKVDAFLSPQTTSFKGFDGYVFDDPTLSFATQTQNIFDGKLDENGTSLIHADINLEKQVPGQLKANFLVKVFEPGGNFSINQVTLPYNVYSGYVGIKTPEGSQLSGMLTTGTNHVIDIADVNTKGALVSGNRNVNLELYKIQWRWWWDKTGDELSNFTQNQYNKLIKTQTVTTVNGRGKWILNIPQADWGRYLIKVTDPQTGHSAGKIIYIDWPNWAERLQQDNPTEAAMLSFTSDKKSYKVGEEGTLTIPTSNNGRALISFESGSKIIKSVWIDTRKGQSQYHFKVDEEMAPSVFVNVTLLQHHNQTVNDLPIRMYGAIPLTVDNPATVLKPVISMPDKIRPETSSSVTVSEASGKEMTYTIAIVDEGILDLTNFKTPDPHDAFYAREALGVKTWDLFDYVIGAYGGGLERILSIGGDQFVGNNKNATVNRFKPVVRFLGPFHLNKGEKQTKRFVLPQYIGSVRTMIVAGHNGSYGFAEKAVAVKKPLMILATLPRVLGPSEKFQLPVTVFALENNIKKVTVQVQSNVLNGTPGNNTQVVTFNKPGDQLATFDLNVKNFAGVGKVRIIAKSGNEIAVQDVELNVRNPNPPIARTIVKELRAGEAWNTGYTPVGMPGTNKATLEVAAIPPINLSKRLSYLLEYPYGCVEQVTSSGFPQLYLNQLVDLSAKQKAETERNIKATISRLSGFQVPGGGISYWPDGGEPNEWGTNYAGHFILLAQANGYSLPVSFLDNWKKFQRQKALNWAPDPHSFYGADLIQSYRLYLLALAGVPELGAMNRLKEFKYISVAAKWRLAAAYQLAGQPEIASQMVNRLPTTIKPYEQLDYTYGSDERDEAMILETLNLLGRRQQASVVMRSVAAHLSEDRWYSTQTTAYSLLAIAEYCGKNNSPYKLQFSYQAAKVKGNLNSSSYIWQAPVSSDGGKVVIRNNGKNTLYVRLVQQGIPAPGQEPEKGNNPDVLQMQVNYISMKGQPIDVSALKQGTDFVAQVTIKNPVGNENYRNLALSQISPSGWEILNTRMLNNDEVFKSSPSDYRDIRDDRVYTYFSLEEDKAVTYYVILTAAYAGKYYLPGTYCEAMYKSSINALQKGRWVEVIK